jgi:hypothetical protein
LTRREPPAVNHLACPLCDSYIYAEEACGKCHAPAPVIESIAGRGHPPRFVGVLGPSGVGKTVYLGMLLDLLARGSCGLHGLARGPFSLGLHRNLILALENQRFPEKTPAEPDRWHWVHCEVTQGQAKKSPVIDVVTPDVAGEAVLAELERPQSNPTIRALIQKCAALVVLVDIVDVVVAGQGQELFAMQLISYLDALRPARNRRPIAVPVALVFTKADLCEEPIRDSDAFARANAPGLWNLCKSRLEHHRFYAAGVAGSTGKLIDVTGQETLVPLRVEPRGIVEPFAWLITQLG